ncbi:brain-specific angiogenesis inhibitor 1-associated protein 2-like protein 2 [Scleropages formosus]|uniref:brain-specific angiogenesis inhibitor 1-associated protein 2-like protein 2 n=1 Tax=Scleropages formosus TaxID=113540 RepID=UPI0010FA7F6D|nr:brain-specific angiogenesis inhibitor 1-associated protein 2-like protein 2 [Scleropages formosus]
MSGPNSDQVHRSTLGVYMNLMDQFNPGLQKLVSLGHSYVQAFQALAATSEAYFSALAKMGEQALHSMSSYPLGDVLIQISDSQRRLTAELEGVFRWFHTEVLQEMDQNVKLDKEYISGSRRCYEMEVRSQAMALQKQLRRGVYRDAEDSGDYLQFLRQSQREALAEEERRYRFLAEKHCGLTQSILYLMNKVEDSVTGISAPPQTAGSLQQKAERWRDRVNETRTDRIHTPSHLDQEAEMRAKKEEVEHYWTGREEQSLGKVPSRGPSPQPSRSSGGSLRVGRQMRALVPHTHSSDPTLLPFSRGETVTVLVEKPRNGWLYGRAQGSSHQGWFPAAYVEPIEDTPKSTGSNISTLRSSRSMGSLLEPSPGSGRNVAPPPPPPLPDTPTAGRRAESTTNNKASVFQGQPPDLFPRGTNPFATVKLKPTATNDRSAPRF